MSLLARVNHDHVHAARGVSVGAGGCPVGYGSGWDVIITALYGAWHIVLL